MKIKQILILIVLLPLQTLGQEVHRYKITEGGRTDMYVEKGEKISIKATGLVTLGIFAGSAGPTGIQGYQIYNIVKDYPHGSLISTIGDNGAWNYIGNGKTITADNSGYLRLYVNDVDTKNNSGEFTVECKKLNEKHAVEKLNGKDVIEKLPEIQQIVNVFDLLVKNDTNALLIEFIKRDIVQTDDQYFIYDFYDKDPNTLTIILTNFHLSYERTDNTLLISLNDGFASKEVYNFYIDNLRNEAVKEKQWHYDGSVYQAYSLLQTDLTISNKGDKILMFLKPNE